jgi:hypothetical protein
MRGKARPGHLSVFEVNAYLGNQNMIAIARIRSNIDDIFLSH